MKTKIILFLALLFCSNEAWACYNKYSIFNGEMTDWKCDHCKISYEIITDYWGKSAKELNSEALKDAKYRYENNENIENYSDYGVTLCYSGEYAAAMKIFQEIEKKAPNKYQTAANIGTTYELLGKLDSALFWIKRGLKINPDSHGGSEWIHVKILEHEIAAKGDANYSLTHSILGWGFGKDTIPKQNVKAEWIEHLRHQLTERMVFVKPENTVVGQLIFEYANTYKMWNDKHNIDINLLVDTYKNAQKYGYNTPVLAKRLAYLEPKPVAEPIKTISIATHSEPEYGMFYLLSALLSALAFCGIAWWKR
jgi:tetratricopeptide (TPR) repeat protein